MRYPLPERRLKVGFAFRDAWFNTGKLHTGEDDHATAGEAVFAPAAGVIYNHIDDAAWGHGVMIAFDGGDGATLWHVDHFLPDGARVAEGQQIATVYDLQGNTHLHVSFWRGQYDPNLTVGALPPDRFPDRFVEPDAYLDSHIGELNMADAASIEAQLKDIRALLGDAFNMVTDGTTNGHDSAILHGILSAAQQAANQGGGGGGGAALPQDVQDAIKVIAGHLK